VSDSVHPGLSPRAIAAGGVQGDEQVCMQVSARAASLRLLGQRFVRVLVIAVRAPPLLVLQCERIVGLRLRPRFEAARWIRDWIPHW
jgi:hypothetical protein